MNDRLSQRLRVLDRGLRRRSAPEGPPTNQSHAGYPTPDPHLLSVVAPIYNEQELVEQFVERTTAAVADYEFELVLVNDGSTDSTPRSSTASRHADPRVRVIHLSRNFGHQAALTAGLEHAVGDVVAMIDADLQDPPELIPEMVAQWSQGADVVYAVRQQREGETAFKLATASLVLQALRQARPGRSRAQLAATSACSTGARSTHCWR